MYTCHRLKTIEEINTLRTQWSRLMAQAPVRTINDDFDWILLLYQTFGNTRDNACCVVKTNDNIVAILPLIRRTLQIRSLLPWHEWVHIGEKSGITDFYAMALHPDHPDAIPVWLKHTWKEEAIQSIHLNGLYSPMPFTRACQKYLSCDLQGQNIVHISMHRTTWEQVYQNFSRNHRRELTKRRRKLDHAGTWHLKTNTDIDPDSAMADIRRLHRTRQHQLGRTSIFDDSRFKQFMDRILAHYQQEQCLDYSLLVLNGRAISFTLGFVYDNRYYHWLIGFDPACASLSPNKCHHAFLIKALLGRGISEFNFMRGEADYKYRWSGQTRALYETRIWNPQTRYSTLLKTLKGISRRRLSRVNSGSPEVRL